MVIITEYVEVEDIGIYYCYTYNYCKVVDGSTKTIADYNRMINIKEWWLLRDVLNGGSWHFFYYTYDYCKLVIGNTKK